MSMINRQKKLTDVLFQHFIKTIQIYSKPFIFVLQRPLIISCLLFSSLFLPFLNSIPFIDGYIDFMQSFDFYTGGFHEYFSRWPSIHPPFKPIVANLFFRVFGVSQYTYTFIGFIFGIVGIISFYKLSYLLAGRVTAILGTILLSTSPLFISVGIFGLTDYVLTTLVILSFYLYASNRTWLYIIFSSCAVLTKEPGLLLPISVLVVEVLYIMKKGISNPSYLKRRFLPLVGYSIPLFVFLTWLMFLKMNGQRPWGDWIFAETAKKGSLYTAFYNITTFHFLNKYAYQRWLQLFFLNFNWVYWIICITGVVLFFKTHSIKHIYRHIVSKNKNGKAFLAIILFFLSFFFCVLTFQTFTPPRYALPLIPYLLLTTALSFHKITTQFPKIKSVLSIALGSIVFLSLFFSVDPVSIKLWGAMDTPAGSMYADPKRLAGNDGITYNEQYLFLLKMRTVYLEKTHMQKKTEISRNIDDPENPFTFIDKKHQPYFLSQEIPFFFKPFKWIR